MSQFDCYGTSLYVSISQCHYKPYAKYSPAVQKSVCDLLWFCEYMKSHFYWCLTYINSLLKCTCLFLKCSIMLHMFRRVLNWIFLSFFLFVLPFLSFFVFFFLIRTMCIEKLHLFKRVESIHAGRVFFVIPKHTYRMQCKYTFVSP